MKIDIRVKHPICDECKKLPVQRIETQVTCQICGAKFLCLTTPASALCLSCAEKYHRCEYCGKPLPE